MKFVNYQGEMITIYEYDDAQRLIQRLSNMYYGDVTPVATGGRFRNRIEYYNFPCSFDIETTTIKPGELDYPPDPEAPPVAFPYLFQWCIYGEVIMCRKYEEAMQVFSWLSEYFRTAANRRLVIFDHNLGYEEHFFRGLWSVEPESCFAMDEHHPVTIVTKEGLMFRDSYKMTNMSLAALTKEWSRKWKKDKEIMDYSVLRTPYTELDDNTYIYSALDVLSLSDAIIPFLAARNEFIWTKCPTSTSFIRKGLKKAIGIGVKHRSEEQKKYFTTLQLLCLDVKQFDMLHRIMRGGNTHANRHYTGMKVENIGHGDIVSSYPTEAVCSAEFPIGVWRPMDPGTRPDVIEQFESHGFCTMFDIVLVNARLKEGVTVPYISISKMGIVKGSGMEYSDNGRYIKGLEMIKLSIFGIEWPIIKRQYDFDDAILLNGYFSEKGYLPDIIRRFIVELYKNKTELKGIAGKEIDYALAKTYVNGVYGCMAMDPYRESWEVTEEGIELKEPEDPDEFLQRYQGSISYYLNYSWGCMIAALGRIHLQNMIECCGDKFLYCDTDSVFFLDPEEVWPKLRAMDALDAEKRRQCGMQISFNDIKGRPHELGCIDEEPVCSEAKFFGAKKYATVENGKLTCTIAGVPKKAGSRLIGTIDNFQIGFNFRGEDTGKNCLWYNGPLGYDLHDSKGRPIHVYHNVAMLPCDYLLSLSNDYMECLSIEGNFHWLFTEADKNMLNEEDL